MPFEVFEKSIRDLRDALAAGHVSAAELVQAYLARIEAFDGAGPALNSIIALDPNAEAEAARLDAERASGRIRGPFHGIPVLLKDNIDAAGLPTTGGSIALAAHRPRADAAQVGRLREAGAIILGKTNLTELAYGITTASSLGGQTLNTY